MEKKQFSQKPLIENMGKFIWKKEMQFSEVFPVLTLEL